MKKEHNISEKKAFKVPEGYFEDVSKKIYSKTIENENDTSRKGIIRFIRPVLMLAAAMIALAIISYTGLKILFPEKESDMQNYTELVYLFDETELIEQLTDEQSAEDILSVESDYIIDYLVNNDIDNQSIIEILN